VLKDGKPNAYPTLRSVLEDPSLPALIGRRSWSRGVLIVRVANECALEQGQKSRHPTGGDVERGGKSEEKATFMGRRFSGPGWGSPCRASPLCVRGLAPITSAEPKCRRKTQPMVRVQAQSPVSSNVLVPEALSSAMFSVPEAVISPLSPTMS
jgi:hypothetical protein